MAGWPTWPARCFGAACQPSRPRPGSPSRIESCVHIPKGPMLLPWQLCLGMGATVAGGVWLLSNTRDPGVTDSSGGRLRPRPETRHDELIETRERVRRQLDILNSPQ